MAVEGDAHPAAVADGPEDLLDHARVDLLARDALFVRGSQRSAVRVQSREPGVGDRLGAEVQDFVGCLELGSRLGRQVRAGGDAGADERQRPARLPRCLLDRA